MHPLTLLAVSGALTVAFAARKSVTHVATTAAISSSQHHLMFRLVLLLRKNCHLISMDLAEMVRMAPNQRRKLHSWRFECLIEV